MERELAIAVSTNNKNVTTFNTIDAIKDAGFKNVFIQWYNKDIIPSQEEQLKYIRKKGLNVVFAHLGYDKINNIWLDNEAGELLVEEYKNDIKVCKENDIPMVIMHLTTKKEAPMYNELGLDRIRKIVDYARSIDMKIAFENTKSKGFEGYLEYVIENIKDDNVGICFDSGHFHYHRDDNLDFSKFKDRIFAVHLHDNDRSDDLHLIPFDGTIDWAKIMKILKDCNYNGPITLELCYRYDYLNMNINDFYEKGYSVGEKLEEMFEGD